jgi:hypothetical protein
MKIISLMKIIFFLIFVTSGITISAQTMNLNKNDFDEAYSSYKETTLTKRRFKHSTVVDLINKHQEASILKVNQIGLSVQKRSIYKLTYGQGKKKVMLWSQMHGDEPTATMALFDLFNFLEGKDSRFKSLREILKSNLEVHFIPMLNPDGAEVYTRRNAQHIDLNRDARDTATPEGKLLRNQAELIKPQFGFNLHDQNIYYNVPGTKTPVTISLLAPAYNWEREVNEVRGNAMKIIAGMNQLLQDYIPGAIAKYDDEHSPRAFGDSFQKWGASTILIESGAFAGDPEKQEIRKLNFILILNSLLQIAQDSYQQFSISEYHQIPFNASQLHDVILRRVATRSHGLPLKVDIAIRRDEITEGEDYYTKGYIEDIGDLHDFYGYDDLDLTDFELVEAKVYEKEFYRLSDLNNLDIKALLKQGYAGVKIDASEPKVLHHLPINVLSKSKLNTIKMLSPGKEANFFLKKNEEIQYAVINGYLIDLNQELPQNMKQIVR